LFFNHPFSYFFLFFSFFGDRVVAPSLIVFFMSGLVIARWCGSIVLILFQLLPPRARLKRFVLQLVFGTVFAIISTVMVEVFFRYP